MVINYTSRSECLPLRVRQFKLPQRALISDDANFVGHYPTNTMITYKK